MKTGWIWMFLLWWGFFASSAQTILSGHVSDNQGNAIGHAMVKIYGADKKKIICFGTSDPNGYFRIEIETPERQLYVKINHLGYQTQEFQMENKTIVKNIIMPTGGQKLKEVIVKSPIVRKVGDTLRFNVERLTAIDDRTIEDVLTRLPGVSIDEKGVISYQGKSINKFYIEGLNMLDGRYQLATKNIRPENVATIELLENHEPVKINRDLKFSDQAAINLKLKKSSLARPIGNFQAATGASKKKMLGSVETFGMLIMPSQQYMGTIKANNGSNDYAGEQGQEHTIECHAHWLLQDEPFGKVPLPKERHNDNTSVFSSVNHLHKIDTDRTVSLNADYTFSDAGATLESRTDYLMHPASIITVNEKVNSALKQQRVRLFGKFERNSNNVFLQNKLNFKAGFKRNSYQIESGQHIHQNQETDNYSINNLLDLQWTKGQLRWSFTSVMGWANMPTMNLAVKHRESDTLTLQQSIRGARFYSKHTLYTGTAVGKMKKVHLGFLSSLQTDYERLSTATLQWQKENANKIAGWNVSANAGLYLKTSVKGIQAEVSLPIKILYTNYHDHVSGKRHTLTHPSFAPYLLANWSLNHYLRFRWEARYGRSYGSILNFITQPYYVTYRTSASSGMGKLSYNDLFTTSLSLNYNDTFKGRAASIEGRYAHTRQNMSHDSYIAPNGTMSSNITTTPSTIHQWEGKANYTKSVYEMHSAFHLSFEMNGTGSQFLRQGAPVSVKGLHYALRGSSKTTAFNDQLIMRWTAYYGQHTHRVGSEKEKRGYYGVEAQLGYLPVKWLRFYCQFDYESSELATDQWNRHLFADAGVSLQMFKRWEFELRGTNLTGKETIRRQTYTTTDTYTHTYYLRPREFLLTVKMKW